MCAMQYLVFIFTKYFVKTPSPEAAVMRRRYMKRQTRQRKTDNAAFYVGYSPITNDLFTLHARHSTSPQR